MIRFIFKYFKVEYPLCFIHLLKLCFYKSMKTTENQSTYSILHIFFSQLYFTYHQNSALAKEKKNKNKFSPNYLHTGNTHPGVEQDTSLCSPPNPRCILRCIFLWFRFLEVFSKPFSCFIPVLLILALDDLNIFN